MFMILRCLLFIHMFIIILKYARVYDSAIPTFRNIHVFLILQNPRAYNSAIFKCLKCAHLSGSEGWKRDNVPTYLGVKNKKVFSAYLSRQSWPRRVRSRQPWCRTGPPPRTPSQPHLRKINDYSTNHENSFFGSGRGIGSGSRFFKNQQKTRQGCTFENKHLLMYR